jgi:glycosyltransferase involved in cell wall biosynthesis
MNDQHADSSLKAEATYDFSLIVPMRNEERYVAETLESLIRQDYPPQRVEILVVDGRSTDASRETVARLAARHPHIRLLDNPRLASSAARNVGIRAARGRFVAIVDCHSFVNPDFLRNAARLFAETGADCLGRPVELFIPTDSYIQRAIGAARTSWLGHNLVSPRYSSERGAVSPLSIGIIYRREVFDRIGLFNEGFGACEDVEFNSRLEQAGMPTWSDPSLLCYYHPRGSLWALFSQLKRYAYWRYRLLRLQRRAFHVSQAAPAIAVLLGVASLGAAGLGWLPWAAPLLLAGAYAALNAAASVRASVMRGFRYLPLLPLAYAAIHFGAAVGFWGGAVEELRSNAARIASTFAGRVGLRRAESRE